MQPLYSVETTDLSGMLFQKLGGQAPVISVIFNIVPIDIESCICVLDFLTRLLVLFLNKTGFLQLPWISDLILVLVKKTRMLYHLDLKRCRS